MVLALSGLYLWWPRRSEKSKVAFVPRLHKKGRLRWRDLHAVSGVLGIATLLVFITSGLPWSGYWGSSWSTTADKLTPPAAGAALWGGSEDSTVAKEGDLDRFGHRISWATREFRVPGTPPSPHQHQGGLEGRSGAAGFGTVTATGAPETLSLGNVARAAQQEHMKPGYSILMPTNTTAPDGATTYGSFVLQNYWPMQLQNEKSVYLNQFTGTTLAVATNGQYGGLQAATELGVLTHMGSQFGLINKIVMTAGCLLILLSIGTALAMWWLRRPAGAVGLPKRPAAPRLGWGLAGIAAALAVVYPLWGTSMLIVLVTDRLIVQRVPRLRRAFNLATRTPDSGVT